MSLVPVIIHSEDTVQLQEMKWGLVPSWSKDPMIGIKMINARSETILEKRSFTSSFKKRRCLIPISGFYEWKKSNSEKIPFYIQQKLKEPFGLAGTYSISVSELGEKKYTFSILTTSANDLISPIHNRMPVIIPREKEDTWFSLKSNISNLQSLFNPYPSTNMEAYQVSNYVNNSRNESPECIKPFKKEKLATLDDFF